jgi:predicted esterase
VAPNPVVRRLLLATLFAATACQAHAQVEEVVKVDRGGYFIAGLVARAKDAGFAHGVALFPGYPGIMKLEGAAQFELRGNFLVRSRRHWLDDETLVVVVDAPSDQWHDFSQRFRSTQRYGADIAALLAETMKRYSVREFTLVGTSEGSVSAYHAARMNPALAKRLILTASVFVPTRNGPGVSDADWKALGMPLLWVHHEEDPCEYTAYHYARRFAQASASPLVTVRGGGPGKGGACQAFTAHGFVGVEQNTVRAMRAWVKSGAVPPDVAP